VEPKEIKQGIALEGVSLAVETPEKIELSLKEFKEVYDELTEELPPMSIQHHGTSIHHDFENPFLKRRMLKMKVFNSSSSYHLLLVHGRNESMIPH